MKEKLSQDLNKKLLEAQKKHEIQENDKKLLIESHEKEKMALINDHKNDKIALDIDQENEKKLLVENH